jgi:hypothetical protein
VSAAADPTGDGYEALPRADRARLDRFGRAFDDLFAADFGTFASDGGPDDVVEAIESAAWARCSGARRAAIERAAAAFEEQLVLAYNRSAPIPMFPVGNTVLYPSSRRPQDWVRLVASLRRAVLAVAAWAQLTDDERVVLLGGWGRLAEQAGLDE